MDEGGDSGRIILVEVTDTESRDREFTNLLDNRAESGREIDIRGRYRREVTERQSHVDMSVYKLLGERQKKSARQIQFERTFGITSVRSKLSVHRVVDVKIRE